VGLTTATPPSTIALEVVDSSVTTVGRTANPVGHG
jgi:hypothetical protein